MKALLRYVVLFAGLVLMVNSCNGVISSRFGTQALRTIDLRDAHVKIGDADHVELLNAEFAPACFTSGAKGWSSHEIIQCPFLTSEQLADYRSGRVVSPRFVAWLNVADLPKNLAPAAAQNPELLYDYVSKSQPHLGMIADPKRSALRYATPAPLLDIDPARTTYLHLNQQPKTWSSSLSTFLLGLLIAGCSEAVMFVRRRRLARA